MEKGKVCMKVAGREAGMYCVLVEEPAEGFVMITGPKAITRVKRRKCNIMHLEPTDHNIDVGDGEDSSVEKAWKSSGLIEKLEISVPKKKKEKKEKKEKPKRKRKKKHKKSEAKK